ncbi:phosphoenolpyruvate-protein kinase (PTS system EI component) [Novosphingobium hassiacum]|uniref:Phosphoenolpyruvate-protein kinase (PTS system EI component) n=1 Tax=Novosphingobium hassiacum TaxID=173676 RepID=A0A7W5ZZZ3_9SPHN|nr:hypothetical protein [Novosphingobium hassiacum]MBB3862213.1 phosphoenolpyruvate-protein kinase (PTS system EI component) [Novosphingobium hassiacum]
MTDLSNALATVSADLQSLDLTPENEAIRLIEAEIARLNQAIGAAQHRCGEIDAEQSELRHPELQGAAIANALLAEIPAREVSANTRKEDDLREERKGLYSGIRELRERVRAEEQKLPAIRQQALERVRSLAAPLVAALQDEAQDAAARITEAYAALAALSFTAGAGRLEERAASAAVAGIFDGRLLMGHAVPVPDDIDAVLSQLANKGAALPFRRLSQISPPTR